MTANVFNPSVFEFNYKKNGKAYSAWRVKYRDEKGKVKQKQFGTEREARIFAGDELRNELNRDAELTSTTTRLTREQVREAESLLLSLGDRYTLTQAVDYFLKYHVPAEVEISVADAVSKYVRHREADNATRARTLVQIKSSTEMLKDYMGERNLSDVGQPDIEDFLRSRKAADGVSRIKRKTWNNLLSDLNQFFLYCMESGGLDPDGRVKKSWIGNNPCGRIKRFSRDQIAEERAEPEVMKVDRVKKLLQYVSTYKEGGFARYFALALFAGIRTGEELPRLAKQPDRIKMEQGEIWISAEISKTAKARKVTIQPALMKWLLEFPGEIFPKNADRGIKHVREKFNIKQDEMRHTFISYHVEKFDSIGKTAREAGNSESVIQAHYLKLVSAKDATAFWALTPAKVKQKDKKVVQFEKAS